jgi:hypothetical protein
MYRADEPFVEVFGRIANPSERTSRTGMMDHEAHPGASMNLRPAALA